jgi:peroxiredoxin Q/BCP
VIKKNNTVLQYTYPEREIKPHINQSTKQTNNSMSKMNRHICGVTLLFSVFSHLLCSLLIASSFSDAFSLVSMMTTSSCRKSNPKAPLFQSERRNFIKTVAMTSTVLIQESSNAATLPSTGANAPDFELPNSRGEKTTLDSLTRNGKWTVLYFYPGAFTSGCTLEAIGFQRDIEKYRALNAQIVGVSVDPVEKNAQFCTEEKLDFYMLSDFDGKISKLYGSAISIPGFGTFSNRQTYLIDPQGYLRWVFTDVESRVPRHSAEVLEKLQEVQKEA